MSLTAATMFSGGGLVDCGVKQAGFALIGAVEFEPTIGAVYALNHGADHLRIADVAEVSYACWSGVDWAHASPSCFPAGTLILTRRGLIPIECVEVGDDVLTHAGRYRSITHTSRREAPTVKLSGVGHYGLEVTADHQLFLTEAQVKYESHKLCRIEGRCRRRSWMEFTEPEWVRADDAQGKYWLSFQDYPALAIPEPVFTHHEALRGQQFELNEAFFWFVGAWVGNGWLCYSDGPDHKRNRGAVIVCAGKNRADAMEQRLHSAGLRFSRHEKRTTITFEINSRPLARWLESNYGKGALGKKIPSWLFGAPASIRSAFLDGYQATDGWRGRRRPHLCEFVQINTVSKRLAIGVKMLAQSLGKTASCHLVEVAPTTVIEGRTVAQRPIYIVRYSDSQRLSREFGSFRTGVIRRCEPAAALQTVYCLTVADDESFVADGIIVHNCRNASQANSTATEGPEDLRSADAVCRMLREAWPRWFSLENVTGYRRFESFERILATLRELGYSVQVATVQCADFGVPQTRRRLILRACRNGERLRPLTPTHCEGGKRDWSGRPVLLPWVGWYAAVEDLIDELPESELAPWQRKRLDYERLATCLIGGGNTSDEQAGPGVGVSYTREPTRSVAPNADRWRALLIDGQNQRISGGLTTRLPEEPVMTMGAASKGMPRALLVQGTSTLDLRDAGAPSAGVVATVGAKMPKGLLFDGDGNHSRPATLLEDDEPCMAVQAWHGMRPANAPRAVLVSSHSIDGAEVASRAELEPAVTIGTNADRLRALLEHSRCVQMTPRALARFQGVPDDYHLPERNSLACKIVGNGVPPEIMRRIGEAWPR